MEKFFSGLTVPIFTPVFETGELDEESFVRHMQNLVERGVEGIYVAGTSGEAGHLSPKTWEAVNRAAIREAKGTGAKVYSGAVFPGTLETIERIRWLEKAGAETVFATPCFYTSDRSQEQILAHYNAICRSTDLNVILYNIPFTTGVDIHTETLVKLLEHRNIVGLKDTRVDWPTHMRNLMALKDTPVGIACVPESFVAASLLLGADGIVTALGNFVPEYYARAIASARAGDTAGLMRAFGQIMDFDQRLRCPSGNGFVALKYLAGLLHICLPQLSATCMPINAEQKDIMQRAANYIQGERERGNLH